MKKNNKATKILSLLGVGLLTATAGITATITLSSCNKKQETKPEENRELFEYSDEKKTKISALTEYAKKQTKIVVPKTASSFDAKVFQNLKSTSIKEIDFSKCIKIRTIPARAFSKSSNITTLLLPPNLNKIYDSSISDLVNIERINWPANISTEDMIKATWALPIFIPNFNGNTILTPANMKTSYQGQEYAPDQKPSKIYLVPNQFTEMKNSSNFHSSVKNLYFQDRSNFTHFWNDALKNCGLERIILPSSFTSINDGNFWGCGNLKQLESEDKFKNLTFISGWNFYNCPQLKYLDFSGNNLITQGNNTTFHNLKNLEYLLLPNSFKGFYTDNGNNTYFNGEWDSLKYMPIPRDFDFNTVNNQASVCSGKIRFRIPKDNEIDYTDLYEDNTVVGIWINGSSKKVKKPDMSKLPNVKFISYKDKTEYFNIK